MSHEQKSGAASQLGAALANIARGALKGGLHGAAASAAVSFAPQILKILAVALCLLVLIPFLVFAALPNFLFGFPSSTSDDMVGMTTKAAEIDRAYQNIESLTQAQIDSIVDAAVTANSDSDGAALYDEIDVEEDADNTNVYWLIAINSVAHQQDLYTMSEQSIQNLIIQKFRSGWSLVTGLDDTGSQNVATLKVDINDLNPEELMDDLRFTDEERRWAYILYSTLMDDQFVDTGGYAEGIDVGDITFTDSAVSVVYYNQLDSRWCNIMYGKSGTIGQAGCGPTALAIAVATFADSSVTPVTVAEWAVKSGQRCEGNGSFHSIIPVGAEHYGLTVERIGTDARKLVQALKDGKLVIALMSKGHFTRGGHFIVLRGITESGKVLVADPSSVSRSEQEWALSVITSEANRGAGSGGPFWVVSP